jgi:hypothetical protein
MNNTIEKYQKILFYCMEETKGKEEPRILIGLTHRNGLLTGFFVNPCDVFDEYVHIWEVRISPDDKHFYLDTTREVMLLPIDGYQFPRYVTLFKGKEELQQMGFSIPESPKNGTLELDDLQWRALWEVKENLKDHEKEASQGVDWRKPEAGVFNAYMRALQDLRDILGDY